MTDSVAFTASIAILLWIAWMILRSRALAVVAVAPVLLAVLFGLAVKGPVERYSKDVLVAAALAGALAVWLRSHLSGKGASGVTLLSVAFLCGVAAGLKEKGLVGVAAFMVYLAVYSRGKWRFLGPLAVVAIVSVVYLALNPATFVHLNAGPWNVGIMTVSRRLVSMRRHVATEGPCSLVRLATDTFFWWPLFPALIAAGWACRREKWFAPVAIVGGFFAFAETMTLLEMSCERYCDLLHLGFFFLACVCILAACKRFVQRRAEPADAIIGGEEKGDDRAQDTEAIPVAHALDVAACGRRRLAGLVVAVAVLVAILSCMTVQAVKGKTLFLDEPLWFMRSRVPPSNLSTEDYRHWAIDAPALNRWIYWVVLRATGLDEIPPDEASPWSMSDGRIEWQGEPIAENFRVYYSDKRTLDEWVGYVGKYAPRKAILAMRAVNLVTFALYLILIWLLAYTFLRSHVLSLAAILPIALSPAATIPYGLAFYTWSGDVFMMTAMAAALLAWLRYHLKGRGASAAAVVVVGLLVGIAVAAKLHALLMLWAFMAYLAWQSRGWRRLKHPLAAAGAAFAVYILVNPAMVTYPGAWPWDVARMMLARRADVVGRYTAAFGHTPLLQIVHRQLYWWPILPTACVAIWVCRREKWFAPLAISAAFLVTGTLLGFVQTRKADYRYAAPLEFGLFLLVSVCVVWISRLARKTTAVSPLAVYQ